jgi:hypothetical protein
LVWITMLAMTDADGVVRASVPGLAARAWVTLTECELALEKFKRPDKYSRSKEHEGRRIAEVDGGWLLLNHTKYRNLMGIEDRREYNRVKQAEYRAKKRAKVGGGVPLVGERQFVEMEKRGEDVGIEPGNVIRVDPEPVVEVVEEERVED